MLNSRSTIIFKLAAVAAVLCTIAWAVPTVVTRILPARPSDIARDAPFHPAAFVSPSSSSATASSLAPGSLAAVFVGDRTLQPNGNSTLLLVGRSNDASSTITAASLDLTLPWTLSKSDDDDAAARDAWIPPTTLRVHPLDPAEIKEALPPVFRRVNISGSGAGPLVPLVTSDGDPTQGTTKPVFALPVTAQVATVSSGASEVDNQRHHLKVVANRNASTAAARTIDWDSASVTRVMSFTRTKATRSVAE